MLEFISLSLFFFLRKQKMDTRVWQSLFISLSLTCACAFVSQKKKKNAYAYAIYYLPKCFFFYFFGSCYLSIKF